MVCTGVMVSPFAPAGAAIFTMRRVSRSVARAVPSGRNAIPHGTSSPCAMTVATTLGGPGSTGGPAEDVAGGGS